MCQGCPAKAETIFQALLATGRIKDKADEIRALPAIDQQGTMPSHHLVGGIQRDPNTGLRARDPLTGNPLLLTEMWDWGSGRRFLSRNGNMNILSVSHYILGADGVLREYDYSEQHPAESTEQVEQILDAEQDASGTCA